MANAAGKPKKNHPWRTYQKTFPIKRDTAEALEKAIQLQIEQGNRVVRRYIETELICGSTRSRAGRKMGAKYIDRRYSEDTTMLKHVAVIERSVRDAN